MMILNGRAFAVTNSRLNPTSIDISGVLMSLPDMLLRYQEQAYLSTLTEERCAPGQQRSSSHPVAGVICRHDTSVIKDHTTY